MMMAVAAVRTQFLLPFFVSRRNPRGRQTAAAAAAVVPTAAANSGAPRDAFAVSIFRCFPQRSFRLRRRGKHFTVVALARPRSN